MQRVYSAKLPWDYKTRTAQPDGNTELPIYFKVENNLVCVSGSTEGGVLTRGVAGIFGTPVNDPNKPVKANADPSPGGKVRVRFKGPYVTDITDVARGVLEHLSEVFDLNGFVRIVDIRTGHNFTGYSPETLTRIG